MINFPQSGARLRAIEGTDDWGNPAEIWADPGRLPSSCWLQQNSTSENLAETDTTGTRRLLFLPAGFDITSLDRWEQDGTTYRVVGDPNRVAGPTGEDHVEAELEVFTTA